MKRCILIVSQRICLCGYLACKKCQECRISQSGIQKITKANEKLYRQHGYKVAKLCIQYNLNKKQYSISFQDENQKKILQNKTHNHKNQKQRLMKFYQFMNKYALDNQTQIIHTHIYGHSWEGQLNLVQKHQKIMNIGSKREVPLKHYIVFHTCKVLIPIYEPDKISSKLIEAYIFAIANEYQLCRYGSDPFYPDAYHFNYKPFIGNTSNNLDIQSIQIINQLIRRMSQISNNKNPQKIFKLKFKKDVVENRCYLSSQNQYFKKGIYTKQKLKRVQTGINIDYMKIQGQQLIQKAEIKSNIFTYQGDIKQFRCRKWMLDFFISRQAQCLQDLIQYFIIKQNPDRSYSICKFHGLGWLALDGRIYYGSFEFGKKCGYGQERVDNKLYCAFRHEDNIIEGQWLIKYFKSNQNSRIAYYLGYNSNIQGVSYSNFYGFYFQQKQNILEAQIQLNYYAPLGSQHGVDQNKLALLFYYEAKQLKIKWKNQKKDKTNKTIKINSRQKNQKNDRYHVLYLTQTQQNNGPLIKSVVTLEQKFLIHNKYGAEAVKLQYFFKPNYSYIVHYDANLSTVNLEIKPMII